MIQILLGVTIACFEVSNTATLTDCKYVLRRRHVTRTHYNGQVEVLERKIHHSVKVFNMCTCDVKVFYLFACQLSQVHLNTLSRRIRYPKEDRCE